MLFGALCHVFFVYLTRIKGLGCILYRFGVILVAFMLSALSAIAQNQQRQADSLLRRVEQLADENPEAMKLALEKFEQLAGSQLSAFDCLLMQARAMASLALGLDGQALQQIDSVNQLISLQKLCMPEGSGIINSKCQKRKIFQPRKF